MKEILQRALEETYIRYGKKHLFTAAREMIQHRDFRYIPNNGEEILREQLEVEAFLGLINIKKEFFEAYIKEVLKSDEASNFLESAIKQIFTTCQEALDDEHMMKMLVQCLETFWDNLTLEDRGNSPLNNQPCEQSEIIELILSRTLNALIKQIDKAATPIIGVQLYPSNIATVQEQMISGLTHDVQGSIELSGMQATTNIGKIRTNQEDAVLLKMHARNPEFKIMVVSDGVGGLDYGEKASHTVITEINKWFDTLSDDCYENLDILKDALTQKIKEISAKIDLEIGGQSGATIVGAIVGKHETLIINVGDSRAYIVKDNKLEQVTQDDSVVQKLYQQGNIQQVDDMRFHIRSNTITQAIGGSIGDIHPHFYTVKNVEYDKLLLFSDGVTDCLSDEQILMITKRTPKDQLSKAIVEHALTNESFARPGLNFKYYNSSIPAGKDNTTAAVYER